MEFQLALLYCLGLRLGKEPAVSCINFYDKWKMRNNPFVELKSSLSCSDTKKHVYSIFSHCAFARLKFQYLWQRWLEWRTVGWRSCPRSQLKTQTKISQVGFRWRCSSKTRHPSSQLTLQFCAMCAYSPPHHFQQLILRFYIMVSISCICHLPSVFYIKRSRSRSTYGLLWSLGRTQFSCPSRVLRDQWTNHLRTALKTHSRGG